MNYKMTIFKTFKIMTQFFYYIFFLWKITSVSAEMMNFNDQKKVFIFIAYFKENILRIISF